MCLLEVERMWKRKSIFITSIAALLLLVTSCANEGQRELRWKSEDSPLQDYSDTLIRFTPDAEGRLYFIDDSQS